MRRTIVSEVKTRPDPLQTGQGSVMAWKWLWRTRWRVISISPRSLTAKALVRARSRPRCVRSSCNTLSRLAFVSMSMKSQTMMPPTSRSRNCRAISRAASTFVLVTVFSGSFLPVKRPVLTSIEMSASVGSMIR